MAKIKVTRKVDGKDTELEIEEGEIQDGDVKAPAQEPGKQIPAEKTLTQAEVNKLMADQRRDHKKELETLRGEFDAFKQQIADREKAANEAAAKKVEALRKDLPDGIQTLLDKLPAMEQLEWLSDPANAIKKETIPDLPKQRQSGDAPPSVGVIV